MHSTAWFVKARGDASRGAWPRASALQRDTMRCTDPVETLTRAQRVADIEARFSTVPFDREAAHRYGTMVALTLKANRDPRPRRMALMIAATAAALGLPLCTRNPGDFTGLESGLEVISIRPGSRTARPADGVMSPWSVLGRHRCGPKGSQGPWRRSR